MANYWGTTNVSEWVISGSTIVVTVTVTTESTAPQVFVSIRSNTVPSDFPTLSAPRVTGMAQAGFTAAIQTTDGSHFTQELLDQANLHIDYLVHE